MSATNDQPSAEMAVLTERLRVMEANQRRLDHDINGNGKPGLKADFGKLDKKIDRIDERIKVAMWAVPIGFSAIVTVVNWVLSRLP